MKRLLLGISLLIAGLLLMNSCLKDNFDLNRLSTEMEFEPDLAAPLLFGSFDMDDLAEVIDSGDYSMIDDEGLVYYLVYADTIYSVDETVNFDNGLEDDMVIFFQINLSTVNELAIETRLQVYLEDENHVVLDSVFDMEGIVVESSSIDNNGKLVESSENENSSFFDDEKLGILEDVAYMRIVGTMQPLKQGEPFVKIYASYSLDYKLSMSAKAKITNGDQN
ncbi:MAG: hypothetical protein GY790_15900 [Bacteroidetes bacterium]|nr:hypothetical protein [Bacteroidota bacterium]